jgi:hypothetical protein
MWLGLSARVRQSVTRAQAAIIRIVKDMRARVRPDVRDALDSFGLLFAVTLFFCLIAAAHEGMSRVLLNF